MNHRRSVLAAAALAVGVTTLGAVDASAILPEERGGLAPHDPPVAAYIYPQTGVTVLQGGTVDTSSDDNSVEAFQLGMSALGGAGVAIAGMWLYRRRHEHIA
jgi:hypothetical protein